MAKTGEGETLRVDLTQVTAGRMDDFFAAARSNDIKTLAGFFAEVVVECPYGDPADPQTYLKLPFYGAFQDVLAGVVEAGKLLTRR